MTWRALAVRHVRVFVFSPLLAIAIGSFVGSGAVVLVGPLMQSATAAEVLQGFLFAAVASLFVTVPFGGVAGLGAACAIVALGRGAFRKASFVRWLATGAGTGTAVGFVVPALVLLAFTQGQDLQWTLAWPYLWPYIHAGAWAGLVAGAALGALAWWEFGWDAA